MKNITVALLLTTAFVATACTMQSTESKMPSAETVEKTQERGTISEASYYNAASSQLYRWWGLVESPLDMDITPQLDDLFAEDVHVTLSGQDFHGAETVKNVFLSRPLKGKISHHIEDIRLKDMKDGTFKLEADFLAQVEENGELRSTPGHYFHTLTKRPDGRLVFSRITASLDAPIDKTAFDPSFVENRAKAVVIQFQTIMDSLGDPEGLRELVKPDVVFEGLLTPPSQAGGRLDNWDNKFTGYDALAEWFSQGPTVFRQVSHKLEEFSVTPLGNNRYEAIAQFEWIAEKFDGTKVEKHSPRAWVLIDEGGKYMQVERSYVK